MNQSETKLLVISDPHLTEKPADQYRHNFMRDLLDIIKRRKPDGVAILGDLTEEKDRHSAQLVNKIVNELDDIAALAPLLVLMGNHDYRSEGHPFFAFLKHIPNIAWIDKVTKGADLPRQFRSIFAGCLLLPHTHDYEKDWAEMIQRPKSKQGVPALGFADYRFVFAHNTFDGTEGDNGRLLEGIPPSILGRAKVLCGDIHKPQKVGPVEYIGAPYTIDFGDTYEPRMISTAGHAYHSVSLKAWPQKRLVTVDDLGELFKVKLNAGDIVKVRIGQDDIGNWGSIHRDIVAWANKLGVHLFRAEPIMYSKTPVRRNVRVRGEAVTDESLLRTYAKRHDVEEKTLAVGLEMLK